jgi:GT2 family glycosyltransferase
MNVETAVIIVNYRTPELTIDCLDSIHDQVEDGLVVVVVDNHSEDGSPEKIEESINGKGWGDWCRLIRSEVNGGFAAGNNIGIRSVEAKAYILLNSDTIVRPGAFSALKHAMRERPDVGLFAPRIEKANGQLDQNTFRYVTPISELIRSASTGPITRLLKNYDVPMAIGDDPFEPQWVGFACVVIRRAVIDQVGLLDEDFFMYFEDIDYCRRVRSSGWGILYWPEARVVHLLGKSSGVTKRTNLRRRPPRYYYESRTKYFKKHFGESGFLTANFLWTAGRCVSLLREKCGKKRPFLREQEFVDIWTGVLPNLFRVS